MPRFKPIGLLVLQKKIFLKFFATYSHGGHLLFPLPKDAPGADNLLGPKYFLKHKSSVHLLISSKFSAI